MGLGDGEDPAGVYQAPVGEGASGQQCREATPVPVFEARLCEEEVWAQPLWLYQPCAESRRSTETSVTQERPAALPTDDQANWEDSGKDSSKHSSGQASRAPDSNTARG